MIILPLAPVGPVSTFALQYCIAFATVSPLVYFVGSTIAFSFALGPRRTCRLPHLIGDQCRRPQPLHEEGGGTEVATSLTRATRVGRDSNDLRAPSFFA